MINDIDNKAPNEMSHQELSLATYYMLKSLKESHEELKRDSLSKFSQIHDKIYLIESSSDRDVAEILKDLNSFKIESIKESGKLNAKLVALCSSVSIVTTILTAVIVEWINKKI